MSKMVPKRPLMSLLLALSVTAAWAAGTADGQDLTFDAARYTVKSYSLNGKTIRYRAYEGLVTVKNPVDVKYQTINFYVPAEYYEGKAINGYTAETAPIFFPNSVGGYMPGPAGQPGLSFEGKANAAIVALSRGLVVAEPGARGRTLQAADGTYYGKAPAAIVDLKAAVRYLRFNDKRMPGNAEKIVSDGTSAGGALSALVGASGNNADYAAALKALGAADARDDVYAVAAYCPIANLENADSAYEWWLGTIHETKASTMGPPPGMPAGAPTPTGLPAGAGAGNPFGAPDAKAGPLTADQLQLSTQLAALFPTYLNSLGLKKADGTALTLKADGTGPFRDYLKSVLVASAQTALQAGTDLSQVGYLTLQNGKVTDIDLNAYWQANGRKKGVPSFDGLDLASGENNLFGTATVNNQHFTAFGQAHDTAKGSSADPVLVKMMNPMAYIGSSGTTTSKFWRIRHGTLDSDTSLAIPAILANRLANTGAQVDFAAPWGVPHSGDYDLDELFAWVDKVCR